MNVKDIIIEDFLNYKEPSMFIVSAVCDWKCCTECGLDISVCQNAVLMSSPTKNISNESILNAFTTNDITKAVVIGGLEPFLQFDELIDLIRLFRRSNENCMFVIYTGYYKNEIKDYIRILSAIDNIIIKFGRFIPNRSSRYDGVLGINLASDNQYAERIS